jgi:hypothetical protein
MYLMGSLDLYALYTRRRSDKKQRGSPAIDCSSGLFSHDFVEQEQEQNVPEEHTCDDRPSSVPLQHASLPERDLCPISAEPKDFAPNRVFMIRSSVAR